MEITNRNRRFLIDIRNIAVQAWALTPTGKRRALGPCRSSLLRNKILLWIWAFARVDSAAQRMRFARRSPSGKSRERARVELVTSLDLAQQALDAGESEQYAPESLDRLVKSVTEGGKARIADPKCESD